MVTLSLENVNDNYETFMLTSTEKDILESILVDYVLRHMLVGTLRHILNCYFYDYSRLNVNRINIAEK